MKKKILAILTVTILSIAPVVSSANGYHNRHLDDEYTRGTVVYEEDMDNGIQAEEEEEVIESSEIRKKREIKEDNKRIRKHSRPDHTRMNRWFIP